MRSIILPSILVVKSDNAELEFLLENISDEGTFKQDDVFWVGAQKIHHKFGHSAAGLMESYVGLRIKESELFKDLLVFQQPGDCE